MEEANNPEEKVDSCPKNQLPTPKGLPGDYTEKRTDGCLYAGEGQRQLS